MKKTLLCTALTITSFLLNAQNLPLLSDIEQNKTKSIKEVSFEDVSKSLETYFLTQDTNKKGSGYKPFKRWEYRWSHYLQADGNIAPAKHLWNAWEQKQKMQLNAKVTSNWTDLGPFDQSSKSGQGRINTVLVDPNNQNIIYVGAPAGGLWRSVDSGINWTPLTDDLPQIGVSGIAIHSSDSNTIYISTGDDDGGDSYSIGVLKSIDGGNTWSPTGTLGLGSGTPTSNEIIIDPIDPNRVWVATGQGMYLSTNGGDSWSLRTSGNFIDFKLKPGDSNIIYAVTQNSFFKSTNGGTSFTSSSTGLPTSSSLGRLRVEVTEAAANNVYILAVGTRPSYDFEGIFISDDNGNNFTKTEETDDIFNSSQAWFDLAFAISDTDPDKMFVGVLDIWTSSNKGDNFSKLNDWRTLNSRFTHADIHFLRYYNGILYAGTDGGVYRSADDGNSFNDLTQNLSISQFYKVSVSRENSSKMAGGLQDNGGFSLSNNTWNNYHGGDGMDAASDPNDENTFYGFSQNGGVLTVTNDGGLTNTPITRGPSDGSWVTPLVVNKSSEVYAGYDRLYTLENNSWVGISESLGANLNELEIDPSNNNIIFASRGNLLYRSKNKGQNFTTLSASSTGIFGTRITSIEVHNSNSNIVWVTTSGVNFNGPSSGFTGGGVFKSIDGGSTFTDITDNLPNEAKFVVRHHPFTNNNSIYVGTALGVYHRNDDTNTWEVFSTNLPNVTVSDLEINPFDNTITAATYGRSVWQSSIPSITLPLVEADLIQIKTVDDSNIISCNSSISPSIIVINNGRNPLTSFTITYDIDGGTEETSNWTGNIATSESLEIALNHISILTDGNHIVNAEISLPDDENVFNNVATSNFTFKSNFEGAGQTIYTFGDTNPTTSEDPTEWSVSENNLWEIGTPSTTILGGLVNSGYVTNLDGNYPDQTVSHLTSPCYNLSTLENPILKFEMAFDLEQNWDVIYMEYSNDEGNTWSVLGTANDPNWYNSNRTSISSGNIDCFNCPGAQWTGTNSTLREYSYDLNALNNESSIIFRFTFISDQSVNEEGVVIDNFIIDASAILSVNDFEEGEFLIYPNPSRDIFNIKRTTTIGENMNIKVYDVTGKLIRSKSNVTDTNYELNMSNISKGLYFLEVSIDNKRLVKKLILN